MTDDLSHLVPELSPECDIRKLPIGPSEAFVLSRIDGVSSAAEIAMMTGLGDEAVVQVLERLGHLGALLLRDTSTPGHVPVASPPSRKLGARLRDSVQRPPPRAQAQVINEPPPKRATVPPISKESQPVGVQRMRIPSESAELQEEVDLNQEQKKRVLTLFAQLESSNHYEILGVERTADKKVIKRAYYELAPHFHPDKFFRKELGSFKAKMEAIFKRLTLAHDTLARKKKRADYDKYLASHARAKSVEAVVNAGVTPVPGRRPVAGTTPGVGPSAGSDEPPKAVRPMPQARAGIRVPQASNAGRSSIPTPSQAPPKAPSARPEPRRSFVPRATASATPPPPSVGEDDVPVGEPEDVSKNRRRALAARLSGTFRAPTTSSKPPPPQNAAESRAGLKRLYDSRKRDTHRAQLAHYLEKANAAAEQGDAVAASNAYRHALKLAPNDRDLEQLASLWERKANDELASAYASRGKAEANIGRWNDAARTLKRAIQAGCDEMEILKLSAKAQLRGAGDLSHGAKCAQRVVELAPSDVDIRLLLVEIYLTANMGHNAKRELEAVKSLAPKHPQVRSLLKKL